MKVLYVSHTGKVSGAERSLLELLAGLPGTISAHVACPDGDLATAVRELGLPVSRITGTNVSFRLHPIETPRGLVDTVRAAVAVARLARTIDADVIHANTLRAGLIAIPVGRVAGPPVIVHVRDCLPPGRTADLTRRLIMSRAAVVLANSRYTATRFAGSSNNGVQTVYNPVDLERFDPARVERTDARRQLDLEPSVHALGVVAQITPWKAQDDAIRIIARLRARGVPAILLLAGEAKFVSGATRYDNARYERRLRDLARELGVARAVEFLGERSDVPEIIRALDLLLVPSWEEPFGRSIVEAMAMEVPVVATNVGGPAEIVRDGGEGLLLVPREIERWVDAIAALLAAPDVRAEMGRKGRERVERLFNRQAHVARVLEAYEATLASASKAGDTAALRP